jgi:hypothetical protein
VCFQNLQVQNAMVEMPMEMQQYALHCTKMALQWHKGDSGKIATYIRDEFDRKHGKYWQCIVSNTSFANSITHNPDCFIRFDVVQPSLSVLLFKTD